MKVLKPTYEILTKFTGNEKKMLEKIARTCYKSENRITNDSADRMIQNLIKNGHEAMIEHMSFTVKFTIDRGISHEFVRHRPSSFAQESTRYVNYGTEKQDKQCKFIDPKHALIMDTNIRKAKGQDVSNVDIDKIMEIWMRAMEQSEQNYMDMLAAGASPQFARSVLTTSVKTELVITANYREWRHILRLRTEEVAHPQMHQVCIPLIMELDRFLPGIFTDIINMNNLRQFEMKKRIVMKSTSSPVEVPSGVEATVHDNSEDISVKKEKVSRDDTDDWGSAIKIILDTTAGMHPAYHEIYKDPTMIINQELYSIDPWSNNLTEDQINAIRKECSSNIWYFLRIVRIQEPDGRYDRFILTPEKYQYILCCMMSTDVIWCGPRQVGRSTCIAAVVLWEYLFGGVRHSIASLEMHMSRGMIQQIQNKILIPPFIKEPFSEIREVSRLIHPVNDNIIFSFAAPNGKNDGVTIGRSMNKDIIILDEADRMCLTTSGFNEAMAPIRAKLFNHKINKLHGNTYVSMVYNGHTAKEMNDYWCSLQIMEAKSIENFIRSLPSYGKKWYETLPYTAYLKDPIVIGEIVYQEETDNQ